MRLGAGARLSARKNFDVRVDVAAAKPALIFRCFFFPLYLVQFLVRVIRFTKGGARVDHTPTRALPLGRMALNVALRAVPHLGEVLSFPWLS